VGRWEVEEFFDGLGLNATTTEEAQPEGVDRGGKMVDGDDGFPDVDIAVCILD
jgi:hypothetical protein